MGIRDAAAVQKSNEHCVNVVVTPTIVLPSTTTNQSTKTTTQAAKKGTKPKTKLSQARDDAKSKVNSNVSARLRRMKKK